MPRKTKRPTDSQKRSPLSRRDFLRSSMIAAAASVAGGCAAARPGGAAPGTTPQPVPAPPIKALPKLRVGLIGSGGRGTGATINCVQSAPNIEVVAMGDLFQDRINSSRERLTKDLGDACKVTDGRCFTGFDNYMKVLECPEVDMVILATPPGFRPLHLAAAVAAGKHVFMEKPVGVDPVGIRSVIASAEVAKQKGLAIVAGTQRRHEAAYLETMRRILDGAIGEVVAAQCYWNQGDLWVKEREPGWSDMEWQCRNWLYFTWLSGDHIVEQHVHNIDVVNWAMGGPPVKAVGMGGRQWRVEPQYGNIFDHFAIEYEYANGARVLSMCRQIKGCSTRVSERLVGTLGTSDPNGLIEGKNPYRYEAPENEVNPYVQEHADLIASIRNGEPLNEARRVAESTLTAIMGRMSAYTGREISWDWVMNSSKLNLMPAKCEFGDLPIEPPAMPGETKLV
ncbi:MAG: Gfo/Idh/MocA family oxidoreductase [Phycisphaerae bacterium]|jgi:predicted dehydrogenase